MKRSKRPLPKPNETLQSFFSKPSPKYKDAISFPPKVETPSPRRTRPVVTKQLSSPEPAAVIEATSPESREDEVYDDDEILPSSQTEDVHWGKGHARVFCAPPRQADDSGASSRVAIEDILNRLASPEADLKKRTPPKEKAPLKHWRSSSTGSAKRHAGTLSGLLDRGSSSKNPSASKARRTIKPPVEKIRKHANKILSRRRTCPADHATLLSLLEDEESSEPYASDPVKPEKGTLKPWSAGEGYPVATLFQSPVRNPPASPVTEPSPVATSDTKAKDAETPRLVDVSPAVFAEDMHEGPSRGRDIPVAGRLRHTNSENWEVSSEKMDDAKFEEELSLLDVDQVVQDALLQNSNSACSTITPSSGTEGKAETERCFRAPPFKHKGTALSRTRSAPYVSEDPPGGSSGQVVQPMQRTTTVIPVTAATEQSAIPMTANSTVRAGGSSSKRQRLEDPIKVRYDEDGASQNDVRDRCRRFVVLEVSHESSGQFSTEKILKLIDESVTMTRPAKKKDMEDLGIGDSASGAQESIECRLRLRGEWAYSSEVSPGDYVNVFSDTWSNGECIVDDNKGLIVIHPDCLVSGTRISESFTCLRRAFLSARAPEQGSSAACLYGVMLHSLFENAVTSGGLSPAELDRDIADIVSTNLLELYALSLTEADADKRLREGYPVIEEWLKEFCGNSRSVDSGNNILEFAGGRHAAHVTNILDVEEVIWSPTLAVKGIIDVSVELELASAPGFHGSFKRESSLPPFRTVAPLELKTGGARSMSIAHRAQVVLYSLLMSERYGRDVLHGVLLYLGPGGRSHGVPALWHEIRALIIGRNKLARYMHAPANPSGALPPLLRDPGKCSRCFAVDRCMMYHRSLERGSAESSGVAEHFGRAVDHLSPKAVAYFAKWEEALELEARESTKSSAVLWRIAGLGGGSFRSGGCTCAPADETTGKIGPCTGRCYTFSAGGTTLERMMLLQVIDDKETEANEVERTPRRGVETLPRESGGVHGDRPTKRGFEIIRGDPGVSRTGVDAPARRDASRDRIAQGPVRYVFGFRPLKTRAPRPGSSGGLLQSQIHAGNRMVVSIQDSPSAVAFATGTVVDVSSETLTLEVPSRLKLRGQFLVPHRAASRASSRAPAAHSPTQSKLSAVAPSTQPRVGAAGSSRGANDGASDSVDPGCGGCTDLGAEGRKLAPGVDLIGGSFGRRKNETCVDLLRYRLDVDDYGGSASIPKDNLFRICSPTTHASRLRNLIVEGTVPSFGRRDPLSGSDLEGLNQDQRKAIETVLAANDYALLLGFPGTGKTTTIVRMIMALVRRGKSVLVTSYTHTAVDNVLLKLREKGVSLLRVTRGRVDPRLQDCTINCHDLKTVAELDALVCGVSVVGATCLGTNHPIFSRRHFDYCVVDEAGQITHPVCLGPLLHADKFVLVGDHFQLPPLVQSEAAAEKGLSVSLFRELSERHPSACVELGLQYRLADDIMFVANQLVYSQRLRCGSWQIAEQVLELTIPSDLAQHIPRSSDTSDLMACKHVESNDRFQPDLRGVRTSLSKPFCRGDCWVSQLLAPSRRVIFLNTDGIPATECRGFQQGTSGQVGTRNVGNDIFRSDNATTGLVNVVEASVVAQVVSTLVGCGIEAKEIGVIAPYRSQLRCIRTTLNLLCSSWRPTSASAVNANERSSSQCGGRFNCNMEPSSFSSDVLRGEGSVPSQSQQSQSQDQAAMSNIAEDLGIEVQTVDKFQGRDKQAVVVSFVRANTGAKVGPLLRDWRRINVALTRAKSKLVIIGSASTLSVVPILRNLIDICKSRQWMVNMPLGAHEHLDLSVLARFLQEKKAANSCAAPADQSSAL
eukprot:Rmarinus@m.29999